MTDAQAPSSGPLAPTPWLPYPRPDDPGEHTVEGTMQVLEVLDSPQLGNQRELFVYLPPSYVHQTERRYPVLYMHDGQNLFDRATAFGEEWHVDSTMQELGPQGCAAIIVGIPNTGATRCDEYSPWKDAKAGGGRGDDYLAFVTDTVKPLIDRDFRTRPGREHTGIAGSSMGGLISLYAFFRRPDVFGMAGVMSPSLWFAGRSVFPFVEQVSHIPGRIYLDSGTQEGPRTLGDARHLRGLLRAKGYRPGEDLLYLEEPGARHHEPAWGRRMRVALPFLLREACGTE